MEMFFSSWDALTRTLVIGVLAYLGIVFALRVSGKRTLSKWNAFDFVVTVALGSALATTIISKQASLLQGLLAFSVLIFLQLAVTWLSVRSRRLERVVKARPTLLLYRGRYLHARLRQERVSEEEVRAALRGQGVADVESVWAVVLETDGDFSVIREPGQGSALKDVEGFDEVTEPLRRRSTG